MAQPQAIGAVGARPLVAVLCCLLFSLFAVDGLAATRGARPEVVLETSLGRIVIRLHPDRAPRASGWVLTLVDQGKFDGTRFYRAGILERQTKPSLIEGGMLDRAVLEGAFKSVKESGVPILSEFDTTDDTGLRHRRGVVSLARDLLGTGEAIPDLVIMIGAAPQLDARGRSKPDARGFPAFGKVISGMRVVDQIARADRTGRSAFPQMNGQILSQPVAITRAYRRD